MSRRFRDRSRPGRPVPAARSPEPSELMALAGAWRAAFANRSHPYALQQPDGTYRWIHDDLPDELLAAHLAGEATLALASTDERAVARWACLDCDDGTEGALPRLLELRALLAELGLPGLVEASRRGGHMWLLLEGPLPATTLRRAVRAALGELRAAGAEVPALELYPDAAGEAHGALGHAVRLPLGVHRLTSRRYPLFDEQGHPCAFTSTAAAARFVLAAPRVRADRLERLAVPGARDGEALGPRSGEGGDMPRDPVGAPGRDGRVGTRSAAIRWVDAHVAIPDLLAELAPLVELRRVGQGYLGWCPFHPDRAPDDLGRPGTPSFYAVLDRRYGWSWRCLSTNCAHSAGPMRHSFRLLQELLELTPAQAIREACARWPEAEGDAPDPA